MDAPTSLFNPSLDVHRSPRSIRCISDTNMMAFRNPAAPVSLLLELKTKAFYYIQSIMQKDTAIFKFTGFINHAALPFHCLSTNIYTARVSSTESK